MTEREWSQQVMQMLNLAGFDLISHPWVSLHSPSGLPDIIALRDVGLGESTLVVIELKTERGKVTPAQTRWLEAWDAFAERVNREDHWAHVVTGVYRPSQAEELWQAIQRLPA